LRADIFYRTKAGQSASTALCRLVARDALLAVLAGALFASSLLASAGYAALLGGELGAFAVSLTIFLPGLCIFRVYSIRRLSLGYRSPLAAPYALGMLFVMLLASGMRN
jgi:hypothetical protein